MPLEESALPKHPDGGTINQIDPEAAFYRTQSKWVDRYCGNCGWFEESTDAVVMPDQPGDNHPLGDGKGTVHRCIFVGGGISRGGYCINWGTSDFCKSLEEAMAEEKESIDKIFKSLAEKVNL